MNTKTGYYVEPGESYDFGCEGCDSGRGVISQEDMADRLFVATVEVEVYGGGDPVFTSLVPGVGALTDGDSMVDVCTHDLLTANSTIVVALDDPNSKAAVNLQEDGVDEDLAVEIKSEMMPFSLVSLG